MFGAGIRTIRRLSEKASGSQELFSAHTLTAEYHNEVSTERTYIRDGAKSRRTITIAETDFTNQGEGVTMSRYAALEQAFADYKQDTSNGHNFLRACLTFARSIVSETDPDRQDIAYSSAWKAWEKFSDLSMAPRAFPFWFIRVVKNNQRDAYRKRVTRQHYEERGMCSACPCFTPEEAQRLRELAQAHLPIVDLLLQGHTLEEAANALDLSVRTIKKRLRSLTSQQEAK